MLFKYPEQSTKACKDSFDDESERKLAFMFP